MIDLTLEPVRVFYIVSLEINDLVESQLGELIVFCFIRRLIIVSSEES